MYCSGEEDQLINEYNYINHIGILQKWVLLFTNGLFDYLFNDIKGYITNHINKFNHAEKTDDNISPEEYNLNNVIYFNFSFFNLNIIYNVKYFLSSFLKKKEEYDISNNGTSNVAYYDDPNILQYFNKAFVPFISPVDIPFAIFEFYVLEDNNDRKTLPYEINNNLFKKIIQFSKQSNLAITDCFELMDTIIEKGFKTRHMVLITCDKIQKNFYIGMVFYIFLIHKFNQLQMFSNDETLLLNLIDNLNPYYKTEFYELLFIILNGILKFFLSKSNKKCLKPE